MNLAALRESRMGSNGPDQDVGVQKKFHGGRGAQSSYVARRADNIAQNFARTLHRPHPVARRGGGGGGTTSAIGFPKRVIRIGFRVLWTRCKTARQVALNLETAISSMDQMTMVIDHGPTCRARHSGKSTLDV